MRRESSMKQKYESIVRKVVLAGSFLLLTALPLVGKEGETGYLKAHVNPGRAGVFVDGKYLGPAANFRVARKYPVAAGEHEVKLIDPRYEDFSTTVKIEAGKTTSLSQALKPIPVAKPPFGRLRTEAEDKFAAVYVNGKFMGHVDEFSNSSQGLLLNPGEYTVKIAPAGGGPEHEETVRIQADQVTLVKWAKK
jgi:PEGA domain-containing protein